MKITKNQAAKLLVESESFRTMILNEVYGNEKSNLVHSMIKHAKNVVYERRDDNVAPKVAAIRALRQYIGEHKESFSKEFPEEKRFATCSLAFARKFVESELGLK